MSDVPSIDDPRTLRALAHPLRVALLEHLADAGTLTATEAGQRVGESAASCSFHLRQLAKYGWVTEAEGGRGRRRPWRLARAGFRFEDDSPAAAALTGVLRERYLDRLQRAWQRREDLDPGWRAATGDSQFLLYVTLDEWRALEAEVEAVLARFHDRVADPSQRPAGAEPVEALLFSYPRDR